MVKDLCIIKLLVIKKKFIFYFNIVCNYCKCFCFKKRIESYKFKWKNYLVFWVMDSGRVRLVGKVRSRLGYRVMLMRLYLCEIDSILWGYEILEVVSGGYVFE